MELTWWPVAIAGFACLAVGVALALLLPMTQSRRRLRPLANVGRLTRLPEYARIARLRSASTIATLLVLVVMFGAAVAAGSRPVRADNAEAGQPQDVMLCVGQPVTDPSTGAFLGYFARQVSSGYTTQRIGLTSSTLRVVPLTRDYQYAAGRFGEYAELARLQAAVDAGRPLPENQLTAIRTRAASFAPPVTYVDYAAGVEDVLALCLTGFPSFEEKGSRRRSLIYLGPSAIRRADEERPALFTGQQVKDLADDAGVQMNMITRVDPTGSSREADDTLKSIADHTSGQFVRYLPSGNVESDATLTAQLDRIRDNPPPADRVERSLFSARPGESPVIALTVALLAAALLSVSLVVLRR